MPLRHLRSCGNTEFVQQESFTICIKNNVSEYGSSDICLKEQLANADDAKATHFIVCLDKSQYAAERLLADGMRSLQGPALVVGNDAQFSSDDLRNYTLKGYISGKASDPRTTGQFGKGALTAYSVADVIQLLSHEQLLILDPHGTHLPQGLRSLAFNFVNAKDNSYADLFAEVPDQLQPFLSFTEGCSEVPTLDPQSGYPGTLFRLPLRTADTALSSQISSQGISTEQFSETLHAFMQTAPDLLLFTRHVTKVSVYIKETVNSPADLKHTSVASKSPIAHDPLATNMRMEKLTVSSENAGLQTVKVWHKTVNTASPSQLDGRAVLAQLQHGSKAAQKWPVISGKMYSTMALPIDTMGLPVHINGPFRMSADRRKLWEGQGDRGQGAQNRAVLKDIIAPAWAGALSSLVHNRSTTEAAVVNGLWPDDQNFQPTLLGQSATAVAACLIANDSALVWIPEADRPSRSAGSWVSVRQACFLPESQVPDSCVVNVGRRAGLAIPEMPLSTLKALKAAAEDADLPLHIFSPALLRRALRCAGNIVNAYEVEQVLSYAMSDNQLSDLHNLYLICLAGQPAVIQQIKVVDTSGSRSQAGKTYFIPDAKQKVYKLMAFGRHSLQAAPSESWSKLLKQPDAAESRTSSSNIKFNVRHPTFLDLANSLPAAWEQPICDCIDDSGIAHPGHAWLEHFWAVTSRDKTGIPEELLHFALVPIYGNRLASPAYCRRTAALSTFHMAGLPPNAAEVLSAVGCMCITLVDAHCASPIASTDKPVTTALAAVSADAAVPLSQLVSPDRLGADVFHQLRSLLARHMQISEAQREAVWAVLRQCCMFEDFTGAFTDLPLCWLGINSPLQLLPNAAWEERWAEVDTKLPITAVKYHTASMTQRNLLQHSGLKSPALPAFLCDTLLPGIMDSGSLAVTVSALEREHMKRVLV